MPLVRRALSVLVCAFAVSGCITGERPSFDTAVPDPTALTGDAAVDAVLSRLDAVDDATFTAGYQVLTRFGELTTEATVAQESTSRRSVTLGDVRYVDGSEETPRTCDLVAGSCQDGLDDTKAAALMVTREFFGSSAAARLRQDAQVRIGATTGSTEQIAGQAATCVEVPVSGGTKRYCALDSGALALQDGADVRIELVSFGPVVDPTAFTPT